MNAPSAATPEAKPQFQASYLVHELRAPVTAIRLGLEILQEQVTAKLADDEKGLLGVAVKNTLRLEGLINDVMDYAKAMSGKMTMSRKSVESGRLVGEALAGLAPCAKSKGVRLIQTLGAAAPVYADPGRLVQIITNLVSNAIKFTPAGGCVCVSLRPGFGPDAGMLVFTVRDTGCGIPPGDLDKVFDAFNQAAGGTKTSKGTGLGLTLARAMVGLQGGRIWAESQLGAGSTFSFTLPLAAAQPALPPAGERLLRALQKAPELLLGAPRARRRLQLAAMFLGLWLGIAPRCLARDPAAADLKWKKERINGRSGCGLSLLSGYCDDPRVKGAAPLSKGLRWQQLALGRRVLPEQLVKLASVFLNDLKLAAKGDWTLKLKIEIR